MYWYSDDRQINTIQFQYAEMWRTGAFYGHWFSPVFLTNILKCILDRQLRLVWFPYGRNAIVESSNSSMFTAFATWKKAGHNFRQYLIQTASGLQNNALLSDPN